MEESKAIPEVSDASKAVQIVKFVNKSQQPPSQGEAESKPYAKFMNDEQIAANLARQPWVPIFLQGGGSRLFTDLCDPPVSFNDKDRDGDGVYMWPQPIQFGGNLSFILFKLIYKDKAYEDLSRKIKAAFMALSSIWCICETDKTLTRNAIPKFFEDYKQIEENWAVKLSKVSIFVEKKKVKSPEEIKSAVPDEFANLSHLILRGAKGSEEDRVVRSELVQILSDENLHQPFLQRHLQEDYIALLEPLIKTASLDINFKQFMQNIPKLNAQIEELKSAFDRLQKRVNAADEAKSKGRALNFTSSGESSESVINTLHANYDLEEPAVVVSILGPPGCGKSTLLNHIAQELTYAPELREIFKMGNTGSHTTLGSEVLSHPLSLSHPSKGDHQLMLIDLEGLGGTEIQAVDLRNKQDNLVKSIMTLTSVLVIIIGNTKAALEKVEKNIAIFKECNSDRLIEKILLLFHDKNLEADPNEHFKAQATELNNKLFEGRKVVNILNKPDFTAVDSAEPRRKFLATFLEECHFVKTKSNGEVVKVNELVIELCGNIYVGFKCLSDQEMIDCEEYEREMLACLREQYEDVKSADQTNLLSYFQANLAMHFYPKHNSKLQTCKVAMAKLIQCVINWAVQDLEFKLTHFERLHAVIQHYPKDYMKNIIRKLLKYLRSITLTKAGYRDAIEALSKEFTEVKERFSESRAKVDKLIKQIEKSKPWIFWVTRRKVRDSEVYGGSHYNTSRAIAHLPDPGTEGRLSGINETSLVLKHAAKLFYLEAQEPLKINEYFFNVLERQDPEGHSPSVLLVIGSSSSLQVFANCFVKHISPLTPPIVEPFTGSGCEILSFDYFHPLLSFNRTYIVCLCKNEENVVQMSPYGQIIAEKLIPAASLTCFILDRSNSAVEEFLWYFHQPSFQRRGRASGGVLLWHSENSTREEMTRIAERVSVPCQIKPVHDFTQPTLSMRMEEVRTEFDRCVSQDFQAHVKSFSSVPASFSSTASLA